MLEKQKDNEHGILSKPKTYTVLETSSDIISIEQSPYKSLREERWDDEYLFAIAFLHDVVEDTEYTIDDLRKEGFPPVVCNTVDILTRRIIENYANYILRINESFLSTILLQNVAKIKQKSAVSQPQIITLLFMNIETLWEFNRILIFIFHHPALCWDGCAKMICFRRMNR